MDEIERAMELGRENKRALSLLEDHCAHARVKISVSELGRMCGLPIGPAEIHCQHAAFFGLSTIDLTSLAVEFYEARCRGCPHRMPSGKVPTIATVAEERRREAEVFQDRTLARQDEIHARWLARKSDREAAMLGQPYAVRDLAQQIAIIDKEPNQKTADAEPGPSILAAIERARQNQPAEDDSEDVRAERQVLETARHAPQLFNGALIETIIALAETLHPTAHSVLRILAQANIIPKERAASLATMALSRSPLSEAGQTVAAFGAVLKRK